MANELVIHSGLISQGNISPDVTNTYTLGTVTKQFLSIYGATVYEGGTTLASKYAAIGQTMYIGTTAFAINRVSGAISLTGITSIDGSAAKLTTAITIATSGGATGTATSFDGSANIVIPVTSLTASYLSGTIPSTVLGNSTLYIGTTSIALNRASATQTLTGVSLSTLTISSPLSGTSYNGGSAVTIALAAGYGDSQNPYASKTANYILAAPDGTAGVPSFRTLVAADIPNIDASKITSGILTAARGGTGVSNSYTLTVSGANKTLSGTGGTLTLNADYTLSAACAYGVIDNAVATAIGTGTSLPTERTIYYGLPTINNSHAYTSSTTIYAPTGGGTSGYILKSSGATGTPTWDTQASITAGAVVYAITFNNAGSGATSGSTYNGGTALTVSYNTIGALPTTGGTLSGALTISSGDLLFSGNNQTIVWNSSIWRQRIMVTDDSNSGTAVFTFQQSSDSGTTWGDLLTVKDTGVIVASGGVFSNLTTGYIPYHTASGLTNSPIYTDGTNIGIGTVTPVTKFTVKQASQVYSEGISIVSSADRAGVIYHDGTYMVLRENGVNALSIAAGNLYTTSNTYAANTGVLYRSGARFLHNFNYGSNGTVTTEGGNLFLGINAGNFTMGATATLAGQSSWNVGIGNSALVANTTGNQNVAVGALSLATSTSGYHNVGIGYATLYLNTDGYLNTGVGRTSLFNITSGYCNVGIGAYAMYMGTTARNNVAVGYNALYYNVTGNAAVAIGQESQKYANDTATAWTNTNISIGFQSLQGSTTPANNTGTGNVVVGFQAMYSNTTGSANVAIGYTSLQNNTTGSSNVVCGGYALANNTSGYNNAIFGHVAAQMSTTGYNNVVMGWASLYANTTGHDNISLGANSGRYIADGTTANTTSSSSIFIGTSTKANADGQTNQIVIGSSTVGAGSNTVVIGNSSITDVYFGASSAVAKLHTTTAIFGNLTTNYIPKHTASGLTNSDLECGTGYTIFHNAGTEPYNLGSLSAGTLMIANQASGYNAPLLVAKSDNNVGLYIAAMTSDSALNSGDMVFNVRENDNSDFSGTYNNYDAFRWRRFATTIMALTRAGNLSVLGTVSATTGIFSNLTTNYIPKHTATGLTNSIVSEVSGRLIINTGSSLTGNIASQTSGTIELSNITSLGAIPAVTAKSSYSTGLYLIAAVIDNNPGSADMVFDVRETDNTDFGGTYNTKNAFAFKRFGTDLLSITRDGDVTVLGGFRANDGITISNGTQSITLTCDSNSALVINGNAYTTAGFSAYGSGALTFTSAPTSSSDTGTAGEIRFTTSGIYLCIATNSWIKLSGTTF